MTANDGTSALAIANPRDMANLAIAVRQALLEMRGTVLKPGVDYGKIPNTTKDVLLKPGAEKLSSGFKLYPVPRLLTSVEDWKDGFFYYRYQIDLMHRETGEIWGTGIGSCNSREKKYGYRWVTEAELPAGIDKDTLVKEDGVKTISEFVFAVDKAETTGTYGKPAEYWQAFKDAIAANTAKKITKKTKAGAEHQAWEITAGVVRYRIPNPEIYDQVNTIDKMAFKRAYVAAVLIATGASEFFTQDMEDFVNIALPDEDNVIEGQVVDVTPPVPQPAPTTPVVQVATPWLDAEKKMALVMYAVEDGLLEQNDAWADFLKLGELQNDADCLKFASGNELYKHIKECAATIKKGKPDAVTLHWSKNGGMTDLLNTLVGEGLLQEGADIETLKDLVHLDDFGHFEKPESVLEMARDIHGKNQPKPAESAPEMDPIVQEAAAQLPPQQAAQSLGSGGERRIGGKSILTQVAEEQAATNDDIPTGATNPHYRKRTPEQPAQ